MKTLVTILMLLPGIIQAHALVINEVMSNPTGTDNGREWIELFNDSDEPYEISNTAVSTSETGTAVSLVPMQGGTIIPARGYAIIGTIVSGSTKFLEDYTYDGILLRVSSSFSLTNSTASLYIRSGSSVVTSIPSYTAAKEGLTLSYIGGSYVAGNPTPGAENQATETSTPIDNATTTNNQTTVPQMSPPSPDIIIYMPDDKVAVAGAETEFAVFSQTRAGKPINDLRYAWAFGDGGQGTGSSTKYRYVYNGRYVAQVEATSPTVAGKGRMVVRVVPPDVNIASVGSGKYGSYVEIKNPNAYDLDVSQWMLTIDGAAFPFPRNTLVLANSATRFSGLAMGFASTTLATSSVVKILFPNMEEVTRYVPAVPDTLPQLAVATTTHLTVAVSRPQVKNNAPRVLGASTSTVRVSTSTTTSRSATKDKRLIVWFKKILGY